MSDSPAFTLFGFTVLFFFFFYPACLGLSFSVTALVNLTTFSPCLRVIAMCLFGLCPPEVLWYFLHTIEVRDYFCAVPCKFSVKLLLKVSRTAAASTYVPWSFSGPEPHRGTLERYNGAHETCAPPVFIHRYRRLQSCIVICIVQPRWPTQLTLLAAPFNNLLKVFLYVFSMI